jgi:hypothetical protein
MIIPKDFIICCKKYILYIRFLTEKKNMTFFRIVKKIRIMNKNKNKKVKKNKIEKKERKR